MSEIFYTKDHFKDSSYTIGDYTYGKPQVFSWGEEANLTIGKFCSIADRVVIFLGGEHRTDWVTTYPFPALTDHWHEAKKITGHPKTKGDVVIENDVWIGYGATILSGVTIGDGVVIGAKSVITKDIPPYTIAAGNPARCIRKRFDEQTIENLEKLQWWNWDEEKMRKKIHLLCSNNIEKLLNSEKL